MDRITGMQVFVAVAERGSLSAAARTLDMSRAMASRYLADLEQWSGARLLHRSTRRIGLTVAGELALERCRSILEQQRELREELGADAPEPHGRIRITASASFAQAYLAEVIAGFMAQHRRVEVELLVKERTVDLVHERVDVAVRIVRQVGEGLVARRLATCRSVLCAAPAYLQRHGVPATPQALATHACLVHTHVAATQWTFIDAQGRPQPVAISPGFSTNEANVLFGMTLAAAGIAMLPRYLVAPALAQGTLVQVLPGYLLEEMGVFAVYATRRQQPRVVRAFLDHLAADLGARPDW